jgi:SAM-dependent methyltransferase
MSRGAKPTGTYDAAYHQALEAGSRVSAAVVLPIVFDLVRPESVVDLGCGSGEWLAEAAALGASDCLGLDGPWLDRETLSIPPSRFREADIGAALDFGRRFDLAICLEAAEHLPADAGAVLIANLTRASPVVLFSAAAPGQGGEGHVNEAFPSRWAACFAEHGYSCNDILRGRIWADDRIEPWYRQNLLLFVETSHRDRMPELADRLAEPVPAPLDIVHPVIADKWRRNEEEIQRLGAEWQKQHDEISRLGREWQNLHEEHERLKEAYSMLEDAHRKATRIPRALRRMLGGITGRG